MFLLMIMDVRFSVRYSLLNQCLSLFFKSLLLGKSDYQICFKIVLILSFFVLCYTLNELIHYINHLPYVFYIRLIDDFYPWVTIYCQVIPQSLEEF